MSRGPSPRQRVQDAYLAWLDAGCPLPGQPLVLPMPDDDPGWAPVLEHERRKVPATHRMVFRTYLDHAAHDGSGARPRARLVGRRSACSPDTVARAMRHHVAWGWAELTRPHGFLRSREYRLTVPDWWPDLADAYSAQVRSNKSAPVRTERGPYSAPAPGLLRTGGDLSPHRLGAEPVEPVEPVIPRSGTSDGYTDPGTSDDEERSDGTPTLTPEVADYLRERHDARDPRAYWRRLAPVDQWRITGEARDWVADRDRRSRLAAQAAARRCPHGVVNGARLTADGSSVGGCDDCQQEAAS